MSTFEELGISSELNQQVTSLGYQTPTPIQQKAIPLILAGQDVIGQAKTGTGKTAAFSLPILQNLTTAPNTQALVLTPTRELALQIARSFKTYGADLLNIKVCLLYGGQPIRPQISELQNSPQVVVGTPGRVIDHLQRETLKLNQLKIIVLDEADEMLQMGFSEEVDLIFSYIPKNRQSLLFSATMPPEIEEIATRYLNSSQTRIVLGNDQRGSDDVEQCYMISRKNDQFEALTRLLELEHQGITLIFVRTRRESTQLADQLHAKNHTVEVLNGELNQHLRESVVKRLRSGQTSVVVATDVAARGLDIDGISLVINYHLPTDNESYIHRIGRTGRAGRSGRAILLITPREARGLQRLEEHLGRKLKSLAPPSPDQLLESRIERLKRQVQEVSHQIEQASDQEYFHYQELISKLVNQGFNERQITFAALILASKQTPLFDHHLSNPLPHIKLDELMMKRENLISAKEGCSIMVLHSGRDRGVRPKDIVGAISHEAKIDGSLVGLIRIEERRSLFEIPDPQITLVIERLTNKKICGVIARFEIWDGQPEHSLS